MTDPERRRHSSGGSVFQSQSFAPFSRFSSRRRSSFSPVTNKVRQELTSFSLQYQDSPTSYPDSSQISPRGNALGTSVLNVNSSALESDGQSPPPNTADHPPRNVSDWNETVIWETRQATQAQKSHPPRPAREGYEWVWFPEGYWAEREQLALPRKAEKRKLKWFDRSQMCDSTQSLGRSSILPSSTLTASQSFDILIGKASLGGSRQHSGSKSSQGNRIIRGLQYISPAYPHFKSPSGERESLYYKVKRVVTANAITRSPLDPEASAKASNIRTSHTTLLLKGTTQHLDHELKERRQQIGATSSLTPGHSNSSAPSTLTTVPRRRRIFGLAPWHRKNSRESFQSTSSSINDLLRGDTPVVTPITINTMYETSDGQRYSKVEISSPAAPDFLNSEASRIDTPHTSDEGSIKYHEYFTSTSNAPDDRIPVADSTDPPKIPKESPAPFTKSTGSLKRHRFNTFELNVPEHLPSSPICPKNPKHSSGGTGVCPYHGRQKMISKSKALTGEPQIKRQSTLRTQQVRKDS